MHENFFFFWKPLPQDWLEILVQGGKNESFSCNFFFPSVLVLELDVRTFALGRFLSCVIWERTLLKLDLVMGIRWLTGWDWLLSNGDGHWSLAIG